MVTCCFLFVIWQLDALLADLQVSVPAQQSSSQQTVKHENSSYPSVTTQVPTCLPLVSFFLHFNNLLIFGVVCFWHVLWILISVRTWVCKMQGQEFCTSTELSFLYRPKPIHCNYQLAHYSGFCRISPSILNRFKPNLYIVACQKPRLREFFELSSSGFRARRRRDFFLSRCACHGVANPTKASH